MAAMKHSVAVRLAVVATVAGMGSAVTKAAPVQGFWDGGDAANPLVLRSSVNWTGNHHPSSSEEAVLDFTHLSGNPDLPGTLYMGDGVNAGDNGFGYLTINSPTLQNIFTSAGGGSGYTTVLTLSGADTTVPNLKLGENVGVAGTPQTVTIGDSGGVTQVSLNTVNAVFDVVNPDATLVISSLVKSSGARSLEKTGAGTMVLNYSAANTFGGAGQTVTVSGGTLQIAADNNLGNNGNSVNLNGGTLQINAAGNVSSNRAFNVSDAGGGIDLMSATTLTINGVLGGTGTLTKTGASELILNNAGGTYSGTLAVNQGNVRIYNPGSVQGATVQLNGLNSTLNLRNNNGGTYNLNVEATVKNAQVYVDRLSTTGGVFALGNITLGAVSLNLNGNGANGNSLQFAGVNLVDNGTLQVSSIPASIGAVGETGGSFELKKEGPGTLTLTQAGTFTGGVNVGGGVLEVASDDQLGAAGANGLAPVTVATDYLPTTPSPVTLRVTGSYVTDRPVVAGDGTIENAQAVTMGAVTGSGQLVKAGAGTLTVPSIVGGGLSVGEGQVKLAAGGGTSKLGSFGYAIGNLDVTDNRVVFSGPGADSVRGWLSGGGIVSSVAQGDASGLTAVGYLAVGSGGVSVASWGGVDVVAGDVVTMVTKAGDINLDGRVNADDLVLMDRGLAKNLASGSALWRDGDVDYDGAVTSADFMLADRAFAAGGGALSAALLSEREGQFGAAYVSQLVASVPEPGVCGLVMAAGVVAGMRRRRGVGR